MLDFLRDIMIVILNFFYHLTATIGFANYGLAIVLLTLTIKAVLAPLTVKQVRSMKAMQEVQPFMKKIQEKYKDKPERLKEEMAKLYKEKKINPLAGCLPVLVQMPFLLAIFYALQGFQYSGDNSFLWIPDLSRSAMTDNEPFSMIDVILPILSAITTYIQSRMVSTEGNAQMKIMNLIMPLFILWISLRFPAGLVLYWVVGNLFQIGQQYFLYRETPVTEEAK